MGLNLEDILVEVFNCTNTRLREFMREAYSIRLENFQDKIYFYSPGMVHFEMPYHKALNPYRFPAISVTGSKCSLNCDHCRGRLLETMIPVETPEELYKICSKIKSEGGVGCLISGGSNLRGEVPLGKFLTTIKKVKEEFNLEVVVHTGLLKREVVEELASARVDGVLIDVIGSNDTIKKVYHLNRRVEDYEETLKLLEEYRVPTIPHIVVGLHYGMLKGEVEALKMVGKRRIAALAIVVLMPLQKTLMENVRPPRLIEVLRVILAARIIKPKTPLLLGCARPRGVYKSSLDILGVRAGVNGIAYPSKEAYETALNLGLKIEFLDKCCSLVWKDILGRVE